MGCCDSSNCVSGAIGKVVFFFFRAWTFGCLVSLVQAEGGSFVFEHGFFGTVSNRREVIWNFDAERLSYKGNW